MALSKKPYKGTRDFFPKDKRVQDYIFNKMRSTAHAFGYEPYDGPLLEEVELYKAKSGQELINDQIYSFTDRGERFVAIRPEMTPTLARMVAQIHREVSKPIRFYAIPNLMRYEAPQKGRLREHWQFNCDVFGGPTPASEVEIVQVIIHLLTSFGATSNDFGILINDRKIVDVIFTKLMQLPAEESYKLYKLVDRSKKVSSEAFTEMLKTHGLNSEQESIFRKYLSLTSFTELFDALKSYGEIDSFKDLQTFYQIIMGLGLENFVTYDPTIVRGLDYYTGIVFEAFDKDPENRRAICGGGAYANLLKIFNEEPLPGIGFGLGDVTLTDFLMTHNLLPNFDLPENDLYLSIQDESALLAGMKLASTLRKEGHRVITDLEAIKFKKVFPLAEKRGAKIVAFLGSEELKTETLQLKNMTTKEQANILFTDIDALTQFIKR